jgi:putative membrane protein
MTDLLLKIVLNACAIFAAAYFLKPKVKITGFVQALITAVVLAVLNGTLGVIMDTLAIPFNVITFGLFSFVVDAVVILIASYFLKGFKVKGFGWALALAVLLSIFNAILHHLFL